MGREILIKAVSDDVWFQVVIEHLSGSSMKQCLNGVLLNTPFNACFWQ